MMKVNTIVVQAVVYSMIVVQTFSQNAPPAFPTAEGYGRFATGGRGGYVAEVTNLLDDPGNPPEGSFRWALKQGVETLYDPILGYYNVKRPLTVVFRVSGIIDLKGNAIGCQRNGLTIAGQTAPGDGICIKGGKLNLGGSRNVIIRYMRFRLGLNDDDSFIPGACLGLENGGSFIIDHCSFSWSAEENTGFYDDDLLTVQWCILSEALYSAGHPKGARSYGAVWGGSTASYHHNLLAHNVSRAPRFGTSTETDQQVLIDYVNNVNYNWGKSNACYGGENKLGQSGSVHVNFVNNYYKPGPAYPGNQHTNLVRPSYGGELQGTYVSKWHVSGNYIEGEANSAINNDNWAGVEIDEYIDQLGNGVNKDSLRSDHFSVAYPINTETAQEAFQSVLNQAGAFPRDPVDSRVINETQSGTASAVSSFKGYQVTGIVDKPADSGGYPVYETYHITLDTDHDGMPDYWETANGLDPSDADDRNYLSDEGYTYLEIYLNGMVGEITDGFVFPDPEYTDTVAASDWPDTDRNEVTLYLDNSGNRLLIQSKVPVINCYVYDLLGRETGRFSGYDITGIDISLLGKGIYILLLETENGLFQSLKYLK